MKQPLHKLSEGDFFFSAGGSRCKFIRHIDYRTCLIEYEDGEQEEMVSHSLVKHDTSSQGNL